MTRFDPAQESAISPLVDGLASRGLVCIGAAALDHHVPLERRTNDVDFVLRGTPAELDELVAPLGFSRAGRSPQRFRAANGTIVDLVPYDDESLARGYVEMTGGIRMSVVGFDLLRSNHSDVVMGTGASTIPIANLPVIIVLKIVAYLDRPEERRRDLEDLGWIFERVLADDDERRWQEPLLGSGVDHAHQGAHHVGGLVGAIVGEAHRERISEFLDLVTDERTVHFSRMLASASKHDEEAEWLVARLDAFARGLGFTPDGHG